MLHKWSLHLNCRMSYTNALFFRFGFFFFSVFSYRFSPKPHRTPKHGLSPISQKRKLRDLTWLKTVWKFRSTKVHHLFYSTSYRQHQNQGSHKMNKKCIFFSYKKRPCLCRSCARPCAEMGPEVDGAWSCNHPLPPPFRVTDVTM